MAFLQRNINIFNTEILVKVETKFVAILNLINEFSVLNASKHPAGVIEIRYNELRELKISENLKQMIISGPDLDNINNHFNLIGLLISMIRFAGLHLIKKGFVLLHGSATILENKKAFLFGDDGTSKAKTLSSIELAIKSQKYIGDEVCFYNLINKKIYGFPFVPIHLRPIVEKHINNRHNVYFPFVLDRSQAGIFVDPQKIFDYIPSAELEAIIYVHFAKRLRVKKLTFNEAEKSLKYCSLSHFVKLLNPAFDRMQFLQRQDSVKQNLYPFKILKDLSKKLDVNLLIQKLSRTIPCYAISIKRPCDIIGLVSKIG